MPRALGGAPLSPRETASLRLLSEGLSVEEIAARLGVGPPTVKTFLARAAKKLRARTREHAVAIAIRRGLI